MKMYCKKTHICVCACVRAYVCVCVCVRAINIMRAHVHKLEHYLEK